MVDTNLFMEDAKSLVPKICSVLKLPDDAVERSVIILEKCKSIDLKIGNRSKPEGYAGAAVYLSSILSCDPRTQAETAKAAGVSNTLVARLYPLISEQLDLEMIL